MVMERGHEAAMRLKQYQVDAFAEQPFEGNPAAIVPLESWLDDGLMQAIAAENNLSETAFFVPTGNGFHLRWFTPAAEVKLCGHATLAAAHVLFSHLGYAEPAITFQTLSGELRVERQGELLSMDFPATPPSPCATPNLLSEALGGALNRGPIEVLAEDDYLVLLESKADVLAIEPDMTLLKQLDLRGVIVTAPGDDVDFVSRFFAPKYGIDEDPVTGSAHCILTPYWAERLGKSVLKARQVSKRSGDIGCALNGERVTLTGQAVTFMEAEICLP